MTWRYGTSKPCLITRAAVDGFTDDYTFWQAGQVSTVLPCEFVIFPHVTIPFADECSTIFKRLPWIAIGSESGLGGREALL